MEIHSCADVLDDVSWLTNTTQLAQHPSAVIKTVPTSRARRAPTPENRPALCPHTAATTTATLRAPFASVAPHQSGKSFDEEGSTRLLVAQQARLGQLQEALLASVALLTGQRSTAQASSPPLPAESATAATSEDSSASVQALFTALAASPRNRETTPALHTPAPSASPVIVLDVTALYSARGRGHADAAVAFRAGRSTADVAVQTTHNTPLDSSRSQWTQTGLSAPADARTEGTAATPHTGEERGTEREVETLREQLALAQSRSLFQQESLVRMSRELAKMQETVRVLTQDEVDAEEMARHTRVGSRPQSAAAATDALESAKDRELRRLRTLLRFSELKKDSDLLPEAYNHLDAALKEMAVLRGEHAKGQSRLQAAQQCVRAVAGCVFEIQDLVPRSGGGEAGAAVRDRLRYLVERCHDIDRTIPVNQTYEGKPASAPDDVPARTTARPASAMRRTQREAGSPSWQPHRPTTDSDTHPVPRTTSDKGMFTRSARASRPPTAPSYDPNGMTSADEETTATRRAPSRRHSAASYVRVQEAVAHARRSSSGAANAPWRPSLPCRPRAVSAPLTAAQSTDAATGVPAHVPHRGETLGRPPTPCMHRPPPAHSMYVVP